MKNHNTANAEFKPQDARQKYIAPVAKKSEPVDEA